MSSKVVSIGAGISTTGQKSESAVLNSPAELLNVHFEIAGAGTAYTIQLEGRWFEPGLVVTFVTPGADLAALFAGELLTAKGSALVVGDIFEVGDAVDTTDNALETAKGSAPVAGDLFMVSNIGTEAVVYIPNEGYTGLHTAVTNATALKVVHIIEAPRVRVVTSGTWTASTLVGCHVGY